MENKDNNGKKILSLPNIVILIVLILITILFYVVSHIGGDINLAMNRGNKVVTYSTIADIKSGSATVLNFPPFINDSDKVQAKDEYGMFTEIISDYYVIKAGSFVDVDADPLGLYVNCSSSTAYECEISNDDYIKLWYIKIRYGVEGLEHCTVVNWIDDTTMYGIIFTDVYTEDEIFKKFNISRDQLREYEGSTDSDSETDNNADVAIKTGDNSGVDTVSYTFGGEYELQLPVTENKVNQLDYNGKSMFSIGDTIIFVLIYNDDDIEANLYGGQGEKVFIVNGTNMAIRYQNSNPFEEGSPEYDDFELIMNNVDNIVTSINLIDTNDSD